METTGARIACKRLWQISAAEAQDNRGEASAPRHPQPVVSTTALCRWSAMVDSASSWLSARPLQDQGFALHKQGCVPRCHHPAVRLGTDQPAIALCLRWTIWQLPCSHVQQGRVHHRLAQWDSGPHGLTHAGGLHRRWGGAGCCSLWAGRFFCRPAPTGTQKLNLTSRHEVCGAAHLIVHFFDVRVSTPSPPPPHTLKRGSLLYSLGLPPPRTIQTMPVRPASSRCRDGFLRASNLLCVRWLWPISPGHIFFSLSGSLRGKVWVCVRRTHLLCAGCGAKLAFLCFAIPWCASVVRANMSGEISVARTSHCGKTLRRWQSLTTYPWITSAANTLSSPRSPWHFSSTDDHALFVVFDPCVVYSPVLSCSATFSYINKVLFVCVCRNEEKVAEERQAWQAIPAILQVAAVSTTQRKHNKNKRPVLSCSRSLPSLQKKKLKQNLHMLQSTCFGT